MGWGVGCLGGGRFTSTAGTVLAVERLTRRAGKAEAGGGWHELAPGYASLPARIPPWPSRGDAAPGRARTRPRRRPFGTVGVNITADFFLLRHLQLLTQRQRVLGPGPDPSSVPIAAAA